MKSKYWLAVHEVDRQTPSCGSRILPAPQLVQKVELVLQVRHLVVSQVRQALLVVQYWPAGQAVQTTLLAGPLCTNSGRHVWQVLAPAQTSQPGWQGVQEVPPPPNVWKGLQLVQVAADVQAAQPSRQRLHSTPERNP